MRPSWLRRVVYAPGRVLMRLNKPLVNTIALAISIFAAVAQTAVAQQPDAGPVVVIRCGKLIDSRTAQVQEGMIIIIRGERIEAVAKAGSLAIPQGATVIDLSG